MNQLKSLAILSIHTCPYAALGGKKTGGMNVYIRELARHLGNLGVSVDIFTRCEAPHASHTRHLGPNVNVIHVPSGPAKTLDPINIYPHLDEFTANVLAYQKKHKQAYGLIHAHYWLSGLVALSLKDYWHIPVLQTFHTLAKVKEKFIPIQEPSTRHQAEIDLVKKVDHILGFTPDDRDYLIDLYRAKPNKITLIPPGIDTTKFKPIPQALAKQHLGIAATDRLLLFVGRLDPIKGLATLLKALATLDNTLSRTCLAIIGGEQEALAKKFKVSHITVFLGSRDQRVLPYYYSAAEMTIIPSSHESFGIVALESMACATPVIASNVGGLQYLIKHGTTGLLVPANSPQPLADAISALLHSREIRQDLGHAAHLAAQNYSWMKITPQILKLYTKLPHVGVRSETFPLINQVGGAL